MDKPESFDQFEIFSWVKDKSFKFISCSENIADLAGEDSTTAIKNKEDFDLVWRNNAKYFRDIDIKIIKGELVYVNVLEEIDAIEDGVMKKKKILITKLPIYDENNFCIGIAGSHTKLPDVKKLHNYDEDGRLWLLSDLKSEYLTKAEVRVLRYVIQNKTSKQIAQKLKISFRTVEDHIKKIKVKLQCSHKNEIIYMAAQYGLTHL